MSSKRLDPLRSPVALVTGSRKGLGRYLAERLVASGYRVVGCSRQPPDWDLPAGYSHIQADVSDEQQVKALFKQIRERFQRLDVAINNAGIASLNHSLLVPFETACRIMQVNMLGTFVVAREGARLMRRRRFGRIINLTSVAVPIHVEGESIYSASKAAIEKLTRVMSRELAAFGITVNAVGPALLDTDLLRQVSAPKVEALLERLAIKQMGLPEDVFNVVEFLIKPESSAITGQVIYLGGA